MFAKACGISAILVTEVLIHNHDFLFQKKKEIQKRAFFFFPKAKVVSNRSQGATALKYGTVQCHPFTQSVLIKEKSKLSVTQMSLVGYIYCTILTT